MIISLTYFLWNSEKGQVLFLPVHDSTIMKKKIHILAQFSFIPSEKELHFYHQKVNIQVTLRVTKRLKT